MKKLDVFKCDLCGNVVELLHVGGGDLVCCGQPMKLLEEKTADSATEKPIKGEVVAVGEGKALDNGSVRAPKVKVGDKVLFGKYSGTEVKLDGTDYLVVREDDIFAILG